MVVFSGVSLTGFMLGVLWVVVLPNGVSVISNRPR